MRVLLVIILTGLLALVAIKAWAQEDDPCIVQMWQYNMLHIETELSQTKCSEEHDTEDAINSCVLKQLEALEEVMYYVKVYEVRGEEDGVMTELLKKHTNMETTITDWIALVKEFRRLCPEFIEQHGYEAGVTCREPEMEPPTEI